MLRKGYSSIARMQRESIEYFLKINFKFTVRNTSYAKAEGLFNKL